jgi:hypothetical protein
LGGFGTACCDVGNCITHSVSNNHLNKDTCKIYRNGFDSKNMSEMIGNTARDAVVGGTISVIGGGKFANGAQTGGV